MSISVNGQSQVPPGFRFHPTEEELLQYYLRKKVAYEKIDLDVIKDVDLNKLEPWDIQEKCKIGSTPQNDWYFFSHKDKKYPTGTRTNRATAAGFWKATGRDKVIYGNSRRIGMRKTLVFYKGRAPHGQKSDWIMHEYRLDDNTPNAVEASNVCNVNATSGEPVPEEGWVVCRIFKKKNHQKTTVNTTIGISSICSTVEQMVSSKDEGALDLDDHILHYMGRKNGANPLHNRFLAAAANNSLRDRFVRLPYLESPNSSGTTSQVYYHYQQPMNTLLLSDNDASNSISNSHVSQGSALNDLDRLVASHINNGKDISKQDPPPWMAETGFSFCSPNPIDQDLHLQQLRSSASSSNKAYPVDAPDYHKECELWAFARPSLSATDPVADMPNIPV